MGVPKLFRYLVQRYPLILRDADDVSKPVFDNFYVDFNGIIHNCTHANRDTSDEIGLKESLRGKTQKEVMFNIFKTLERLFDIVEPQKLLFLAIDGVAPRAKMNQQRQRRYKTAVDHQKTVQRIEESETLKGRSDQLFDSNSISPGTQFMTDLNEKLKEFIQTKINTDRRWKTIRIILSGPEVPGEGEHKISEFIRSLKSQAKYNPNTTHCLYGLDADLIALGLATHEPYFSILREKVIFRTKKQAEEDKQLSKQGILFQQTDQYQFISITVLRDYLEMEFRSWIVNFKFNLERVIDDFVFLCFLVGNDFLPCLPFLEIDEDGIDLILKSYKEFTSATSENPWKNYLVNAYEGKLQFRQFFELLSSLSLSENTAIIKKAEAESKKEKKSEDGTAEDKLKSMLGLPVQEAAPQINLSSLQNVAKYKERYYVNNKVFKGEDNAAENSEEKEKSEEEKQAEEKKKEEESLKRRDDEGKKVKEMAEKYMEGLVWTLNYYYQGHLSWSWFYPFFTAPFVQDIVYHLNPSNKEGKEEEKRPSFTMSAPLSPFTQLLCILPPSSSNLLPEPYRNLLTSSDSPLVKSNLFPKEFDWILDHKGREWKNVAVIPFVDESTVTSAIAQSNADSKLNEEEKKRNSFGLPSLFYFDSKSEGKEAVKVPFLEHQKSNITDRVKSTPFSLPPIPSREALIEEIKSLKLSTEPIQESAKDNTEKTTKSEEKKNPGKEPFLPAPHPLYTGKEIGFASFPHLKALPFAARLEKIGVKIVGSHLSKQETMTIQLLPQPSSLPHLQELATKFIGNVVYAEWPYLTEAKVLEVLNSGNTLHYSNRGKLVTGLMDKKSWGEIEEKIRNQFLQYKGINFDGPLGAVLKVQIFSGMSQRNDSRHRNYSSEETLIPLEALVTDEGMVERIEEQRNKLKKYLEFQGATLEQLFPKNATVFYVGSNFSYHGSLGKVLAARTSDNTLDVELDVPTFQTPTFGALAVTSTKEKYFTNNEIATQLGVSALTLSRITGSVTCKPGDIDVGLGVKYSRKNLMVNGFARQITLKPKNPNDKPRTVWEYSQQTVQLLKEWKEKFPEFFSGVDKDPSQDAFDLAAMFGDKQEEKTKEMVSWLSKTPVMNCPLVPCDSLALDNALLRTIETKAQEHVESVNRLKNSYKKQVLKGIQANEVLTPQFAGEIWSTAHAKKFELGDRVINVRDTGAVPIGYQGTVVSLRGSQCEVLFDQEFLAGTNLQNRIEGLRGASTDTSSLLNLTHPDIVLVQPSKEKRGKEKAAPSKTVTSNPWDLLDGMDE